MAKIKIREGSLSVELEGDRGHKHGTLDDPGHRKGERVRIEFSTYGTKFTFVEGQLISEVEKEA